MYVGCGVRGVVWWKGHAGCCKLSVVFLMWGVVGRLLEVGCWKLYVGSCMLAVGSCKVGVISCVFDVC